MDTNQKLNTYTVVIGQRLNTWLCKLHVPICSYKLIKIYFQWNVGAGGIVNGAFKLTFMLIPDIFVELDCAVITLDVQNEFNLTN